jgi:hypothetical protein
MHPSFTAPLWIDPKLAINQDLIPWNNSNEFTNYFVLSLLYLDPLLYPPSGSISTVYTVCICAAVFVLFI